jgi:Do/DeqQ family serine protease
MSYKGIVFLASLVLLIGLDFTLGYAQEQKKTPATKVEITLSFAPLVKKAAPAVVNIYTKKTVTASSRKRIFDDPFFRRFFGKSFGPKSKKKKKKVENSLGSGVIVRAEGIVVTNNHVIAGSDEITIALNDRREYPATIIVADKRTDLAILKVETGGDELPYLEFRDSDDLEIGDLVLAIGNPFGVGQTVTSGIISALDRAAGANIDIQSFIQTDASINPGNSGGALLTMDGRLAGINSAIFSKSGGSLGIGFAIPSNLVQTILVNALDSGTVVRPWLGASGQNVTRDVADGLGLDRPGGVLINGVYQKGPAEMAGLAIGDVIVGVGGREVADVDALEFRLATGVVGENLDLEILRDNQAVTLMLPLQIAPEYPPRNLKQLEGMHPLSGVVIGNLSPRFALEVGLDPLASGVVIYKIKRNSIAADYGLRPRDIIETINNVNVTNIASLMESMQGADGNWKIFIRRGLKRLSLNVSQ